jgi:AbrB family looped-hinge helix DNA binding protein
MIDMNTVTVSPKFQVVIPLEVRRRMKLQPGTRLAVIEFNGGLRMFPLLSPSTLRGIARGVGTDIESEPDREL